MPRKTSRKPPRAQIEPSIAFIADVHVENHGRFGGPLVHGVNRRGAQTIEAFKAAIVAAQTAGARCVAVCGDLFHRSNPGPKLIAEVQRAIQAKNMSFLLVPGNHDMQDATAEGGNSALDPLSSIASVPRVPTWYSLRDGTIQILAVPFDARGRMDAYLVDVLAHADEAVDFVDRADASRILVTHVGVYDGESAPHWMTAAKDAISAEDLTGAMVDAGIRQAFVGNYHEPREWNLVPEAHIVQVGTLCPHRWDAGDVGLDRGWVALSDGQGVERIQAPGPRFLDVTPAQLGVVEVPPGCSLYVRQVGGEAPSIDPASRGWEALDHKPERAAGGAPGELPRGNVISPEEAIRKSCAAHPLSSAGWLASEQFFGAALETFKDASK